MEVPSQYAYIATTEKNFNFFTSHLVVRFGGLIH